jgi:hypothetical protein
VNLEGLFAAAFLDLHGRFAKDPDAVVTVRLWFNAESPATFTDLTLEAFDALTLAEREQIRNTGSGAGLIVTEGISNA